MMEKPLILIIEDEEAIQEMLTVSLAMAGFTTMTATNTRQAEKKNQQQLPDLILLDWMLPGQSGVDYLQKLRNNATTMHIPIILLTAKAEEENKIRGLEAGADDYIIKPFSPRELITRIKTVLRRGPLVSTEGLIRIQSLSVNVHSHDVMVGEKHLDLTPMTFQLLLFFMRHQNRIYSREQLLTHVWGGDKYVNDRTVDVQIRRLRNALKAYGYDHLIHTVYGVGYQFSESP